MLSNATQQLIEVARDRASSPRDFQNACSEFYSHVGTAEAAEVRAAIIAVAGSFSMEDPRRVAILALICGALAEDGQSTDLFAKPLLDRFSKVLELAVGLVNEIEPKLPEAEVETDEEADDDDDDIDDDDSDEEDSEEMDPTDIRSQMFEEERGALGAQWETEKIAWDSLEQFWPPVILVLSLDPELRREYKYLMRNADRIAEFHVAGYWVKTLLTVLHDEPIVVIEPGTKTGILARMSGVVDNFQLHMILMDVFPHSGLLPRRRISKEIADVAKGIGPQNLDKTVTGAWNLYDWRAITSDLKLPKESQLDGMEYWIWNEGTPSDIPVMNGRRVILLGPAAYQRQWGAGRTFERLPAEIVIERSLNRNEVKEWLTQMKTANQ